MSAINQTEWSRLLALEGVYNLRDIGDYPTSDGKLTKRGVVLRSGNLDKLPPTSQQALLERKLKTVLDLRTKWETTNFPNVFAESSTVNYVAIPLFDEVLNSKLEKCYDLTEMYQVILQDCQANIKQIISTIAANISDGSIIIHCSAGKDRTGITVAMLLNIAGVADEIIAEDYALSATQLKDYADLRRMFEMQAGRDLEKFERHMNSNTETMLATLAFLQAQHRSPIGYLQAAGVTGREIELIRASLIG